MLFLNQAEQWQLNDMKHYLPAGAKCACCFCSVIKKCSHEFVQNLPLTNPGEKNGPKMIVWKSFYKNDTITSWDRIQTDFWGHCTMQFCSTVGQNKTLTALLLLVILRNLSQNVDRKLAEKWDERNRCMWAMSEMCVTFVIIGLPRARARYCPVYKVWQHRTVTDPATMAYNGVIW